MGDKLIVCGRGKEEVQTGPNAESGQRFIQDPGAYKRAHFFCSSALLRAEEFEGVCKGECVLCVMGRFLSYCLSFSLEREAFRHLWGSGERP